MKGTDKGEKRHEATQETMMLGMKRHWLWSRWRSGCLGISVSVIKHPEPSSLGEKGFISSQATPITEET